MRIELKHRSVLPGFGLTMGFTLLYLSLIVLIPLAALVFRTAAIPWSSFGETLTDARVLAAFRLSFGASVVGAAINTLFGFIVAWVLVRYPFPGRKLADAMVDLPFALPTAVSGIALTALYAPNGWIGRWLSSVGIAGAYSRLGVVIALTFIGLPFVVRTLQPALEDLDPEIEEAAASLGASRLQTFLRVVLPTIFPSLLAGFTLALARGLGEYGSVVFIAAGDIQGRTEIVPVLIRTKLEEYDFAGAAAIALIMLLASFVLLVTINVMQWWSRRYA